MALLEWHPTSQKVTSERLPYRKSVVRADSLVSISSPEIPAEYRQNVLALQRRKDWDGEGAEPITAAACRAALRFVELVVSATPELTLPRVAPSVRGAVSLYWRNGDEHLVVAISSGDLARIAIHWEGPAGGYEDEVVDSREAAAQVFRFHRRLS